MYSAGLLPCQHLLVQAADAVQAPVVAEAPEEEPVTALRLEALQRLPVPLQQPLRPRVAVVQRVLRRQSTR